MEAGNEDLEEKGKPMVKRLDSIVGSDQWGRKKKGLLLGQNLGGKIKRGILGIDLWGKKKRAEVNLEDDAEEIVQRNTGEERMMGKRAILGLDLWGRRKRITSSRNIMLGTADRCPHLSLTIKIKFFKEELSRWVKGEAGQWVCLFDTYVDQVLTNKNYQVENNSRQSYFIHSRSDLPPARQSQPGKGDQQTFHCNTYIHSIVYQQETNFVFFRNNDRLEKVSMKYYKHQ